jgi:signal transduction histidine kinase
MAGTTTESLLGRTAAALLGEGARAWPVSPDPARDIQPSFEAELATAASGRLPVSVSPRALRDELGRIDGWLAVVADISERRRTDDMLRWIARATAPLTGEAFFRELMRHMADAFRFKYAFITECVDYPVTRLRTLACWAGSGFAPNEEYALTGTPCEETVKGRRVCCIRERVEDRYPAEQGMGVQGYLGVPIMDSSGEHIIGHVAFLSETPMDEAVLSSPLFQILTSRAGAELRRKRAEEQGRQHLQQLAQVSRALALGEMGSAIAHELNQPLAAVATYAQASRRMLEAGDAGGEVRHALERIAAQAERAGEILRRLRGFLAGSGALPAIADLGRLTSEVIDLARPEAHQRGVALAVELAPDLPPVRVDGIQVQQVVLNLVRNAIDACAGGTGDERVVSVMARAENGGAAVAVSDTGPGVAPELAERVFEPFFTTKADGTGIGLAISRSIAEAHGGRLRLEQPEHGGARFVFWLPGAGKEDD